MVTHSYGFDFLNTLSQKIGDLSGFVQMSRELVQNADDEGCEWIQFQFTEDALIVRNPSVFSDDDFEKIRIIGREGKIEDAEKTGRFGVGFVSVFQICDHPVIRSNGRQLTIYPERQEAEEEELQHAKEGTEFFLSWARSSSAVREKLKRSLVTADDAAQFAKELIPSLPETMLFLRHVRRIELVLEDGHYEQAVRLPDKGHIRTVVHKANRQDEDVAETRWLVVEHPETKEVQISGVARRDGVGAAYRFGFGDKEVPAGLVYCTLPTRTPTGLSVNVNADFSIKSDRMTLADQGNSSDVFWNRELVAKLGGVYVELIEAARDIVSDEEYARLLPPDEYFNPICEMLGGIHERFHEVAHEKKILKFTAKDGAERWGRPIEGKFLSSKEDPELYLCLRRLGASLVVTPLQWRWNLLSKKMGVRLFTISDLGDLLEEAGFKKGNIYNALPFPLLEEGQLDYIYEFIYQEIERRNAPATNLEIAKGLPLCPCRDGSWRSFSSVFDVEQDLLGAIPSIAKTYPIIASGFKSAHRVLYDKLCSKRDLDLVIEELQGLSSETIGGMANTGAMDIFALYDCLTDRRQKLQKDEHLRRQLSSLNIFPARRSGEFKPLKRLSLPGNFDDPIGLDLLIDTVLIDKSHEAVLKILGIKELDLIEYLRLLCPGYFEDHVRYGAADKRVELLDLVRRHLPDLDRNPELIASLKETKCVLGHDGNYHKARECYFEDVDLAKILHRFPQPNEAYGSPLLDGWRRFLEILGVNSKPKIGDVVRELKSVVARPFAEACPIVEEAFYYLARRFSDLDNGETRELEQLRYVEWLPIMGADSFELPGQVYLNSVAKLVGRKGKILRFTREREITGEFRDCIGINARPSLDVVIENLKDHLERRAEPDSFLYRELNNNVKDLSERQQRTLRSEPLLYLDANIGFVHGERVYWTSHPFGDYRYILPDKYRELQRLMQEVMGVKNEFRTEDYLDVLQEIADGDRFHSKIEGQQSGFIESLYIYLSSHLCALREHQRGVTELQWKERFKDSRVVLSNFGFLRKPSHTLFADKDWALKVFKDTIEDSLVDKNPATWPFLNSLGVRPLSSAAKVEHIAQPERTESSPVQDKLKLGARQKALERIVETYRQTNPRHEWRLLTVQNLEVTKCEALEVEFSIEIDGRKIPSGLKNPESHYDEVTSNLYVLNSLPPEVGLLEVARRIAGILNPKIDPSSLCLQIKYVIDPDLTDDQVHQYLTYIGIDEIADQRQIDPGSFAGKKLLEETLSEEEPENEKEPTEEPEGKEHDPSKGQSSSTTSRGSSKGATSEPNPEEVVDKRKEYFKKRREYYQSRDAFESNDRWSKEMQDDRRPLTPEEKEEHAYNVRVFYNREIRNISAQLDRLEKGEDVFDIYSSEWDAISVEIRERDGNKCRRCGLTADELREFGSHLTVHHIVPRKEGGSNWPSNLITLCVPCHREVEGHPELL